MKRLKVTEMLATSQVLSFQTPWKRVWRGNLMKSSQRRWLSPCKLRCISFPIPDPVPGKGSVSRPINSYRKTRNYILKPGLSAFLSYSGTAWRPRKQKVTCQLSPTIKIVISKPTNRRIAFWTHFRVFSSFCFGEWECYYVAQARFKFAASLLPLLLLLI